MGKLTDEKLVAHTIGMMVYQARVSRGYSQERLAKALKTKQAAISRLENGRTLPSIKTLLKVSKALGSHLIPPKVAFLKEVIGYRRFNSPL